MRPRTHLLTLTAALTMCTPGHSATPSADPMRPVLSLSLDEAVGRALENNADISVARHASADRALEIQEASGTYDLRLASTLSGRSRRDPVTSILAGTLAPETTLYALDATADKNLARGGQLSVDFTNARTTDNSAFSFFAPAIETSLTLRLRQPVLRNFRTDAARWRLVIARKSREITDVELRQLVLDTVAEVKSRYYDLVYAIENVDVQRKSFDLANQLLSENRIRLRAGRFSPLDVVEAESEVAAREEGVIVAEAAAEEAEDVLKKMIVAPGDAGTWPLHLVPTDRPVAAAPGGPLDWEAAARRALSNRTDVAAARKRIENAEATAHYGRNQQLPQVDIAASYGGSGIGGTLLERAPTGTILGEIPGGYADAVSDLVARDFPHWTVEVHAGHSPGNRRADGLAAGAEVARAQAVASLARLEMDVILQVRRAVRAIDVAHKRVLATGAARRLQEQRLRAEETELRNGRSTSFFITRAQRDLGEAQVAELRAMADQRKSQIDFERVQEAGVSAAGTTLLVTSTPALTAP